MQPAPRFQTSPNTGAKDMGPPSQGGAQGPYGNTHCDVGDAWMGGVADIAGTQYRGCSSAGSDGEYNVQGRFDVSDNDGSQRRGPTSKGKVRAPIAGGCGDGDAAARGKPRSPYWNTNESLGLLRYLFEEDALQQKRKGRQKMRTKKEKYEGIIRKLVEKGFEARTVDECECKFYTLLDNGKKIRDFHLRSGERIYWNMDRVSRRKEGLPVLFDKQLFEALQWKLRKTEGSCEGVMNSVLYNEGGTRVVTDDEDTGGGSRSPSLRRREGSDGAEGSKNARSEGSGGTARRNTSGSSVEGSRGGTFADVAHALVESSDRQADKLAGGFASVMDGINNTLAQGNTTLLQCFTMLSGSLSRRPADKGAQ
ncbi:hypothetical protein CBR_g46647 [Chara braunii]|nr:hypothetical protein CBR_g46647 [Chara braunii]|eukprot:GBG88159.1 hypothetical protein CBR_g46647 [Chara braunii]